MTAGFENTFEISQTDFSADISSEIPLVTHPWTQQILLVWSYRSVSLLWKIPSFFASRARGRRSSSS